MQALKRPLALYLGRSSTTSGRAAAGTTRCWGAEIAVGGLHAPGGGPRRRRRHRVAGAEAPAHVDHRAAARPLRPRPHPLLRRGGRDARSPREALPPHLRRHRHGRAAHLDRVEGAAPAGAVREDPRRRWPRGERRPEPGTAENAGRSRVAEAAGLGAATRRAARSASAFLAAMPARYFLTVAPAEAPRHLRLLQLGRSRPLAAQVRHHSALGYSEVALTARDRPGLLAIVAGVLAAHRIDIQHAEVFSTAGRSRRSDRWRAGRSTSSSCAGPEESTLSAARWRAARRRPGARAAPRGVARRAHGQAAARPRRCRPSRSRGVPTRVVIDNDSARAPQRHRRLHRRPGRAPAHALPHLLRAGTLGGPGAHRHRRGTAPPTPSTSARADGRRIEGAEVQRSSPPRSRRRSRAPTEGRAPFTARRCKRSLRAGHPGRSPRRASAHAAPTSGCRTAAPLRARRKCCGMARPCPLSRPWTPCSAGGRGRGREAGSRMKRFIRIGVVTAWPEDGLAQRAAARGVRTALLRRGPRSRAPGRGLGPEGLRSRPSAGFRSRWMRSSWPGGWARRRSRRAVRALPALEEAGRRW